MGSKPGVDGLLDVPGARKATHPPRRLDQTNVVSGSSHVLDSSADLGGKGLFPPAESPQGHGQSEFSFAMGASSAGGQESAREKLINLQTKGSINSHLNGASKK